MSSEAMAKLGIVTPSTLTALGFGASALTGVAHGQEIDFDSKYFPGIFHSQDVVAADLNHDGRLPATRSSLER